MTRNKHYTDKYYAKDGYRTKQYTAKLNQDPRYAQPMPEYTFNEFSSRVQRRSIARRTGVFKLGIWGDTTKSIKNIQTYVKEPTND